MNGCSIRSFLASQEIWNSNCYLFIVFIFLHWLTTLFVFFVVNLLQALVNAFRLQPQQGKQRVRNPKCQMVVSANWFDASFERRRHSFWWLDGELHNLLLDVPSLLAKRTLAGEQHNLTDSRRKIIHTVTIWMFMS